MTNRVAVDKPLTLRSVNGPEVTVIRGYQVPGTTNGDGAVRCVYLTNGAALVGFTLTNGATRSSGDYDLEQSGGGGAHGGTLNNCTLTGNSAEHGGGAYLATLNNCTLSRNSAEYDGGGAFLSTLNNCTLNGNSAEQGGGATGSTLNNCTLTGNSAAGYGGGAFDGTLNNCTLTRNSAGGFGGGASGGTLNNCALIANSASYGGGVCGGTLNNCAITGNSAGYYGGGASSEYCGGITLNNCIVYFNIAPTGANYSGADFNYCCTTPLPPTGVGNLTADPQLASASHISVGSPCRGAGNPASTTGVDIDGEPWASPPSIGCDEHYPGAERGPLTVAIQASFTSVAVGFEVNFTAQINGSLSASQWEFGDGMVVSNRPFAAHAWSAPGDFPVVLRAYNQSNPGGVSATVTVRVLSQPVHYVAADSASPVAPFSSWATAATNIQDAADAATVVGALVLVSNGVYQAGQRAVYGTNRVVLDKPLTVRSVNGPEATVINGANTVRCVYLSSGAVLVGFTLTNGAAWSASDYPGYEGGGGGVLCESLSVVVSNCVLSGNSASEGGGAYGGTMNNCTLSDNSAGDGGGATLCILDNCRLTGNSAYNSGGGAAGSTLNNCTLTANIAYRGVFIGGGGGGASGGTLNDCMLTDNWAERFGGGAYFSTLNNCTLTGNSAGEYGGGAFNGTLNNCIVYFNTAPNGAYYYQGQYGGILNYCCTSPLPTNGVGNFTSEPLFVDQYGGNLRLQANSPCINAGFNGYAPAGRELDGNPRISGGIVDIGAYEFQFNQSPVAVADVSPLFALSPTETNLFILAPNNANATVVLDGSQSSDADNDPLQFFWYADGQTNALATSAVSARLFAIGPHTVRLVVSDGRDSASAQVSFQVITPGMAVGQLQRLVENSELGTRNAQPLLATLSAAMASFDRGDTTAGFNQLTAFQNKARAQIGRSNSALAAAFVRASQNIQEVLNGTVREPDAEFAEAQEFVTGTAGVATRRAVVNFSEIARQSGGNSPSALRDSPRPASNFQAFEDNGGSEWPPDTHGAVGPNHLMLAHNVRARIQTRSGAVLSTVHFTNFWGAVGPFEVTNLCYICDPRCLYDPYGSRWIMGGMAEVFTTNSAALIGVSQTDDPTGNWNLYRIRSDAAGLVTIDYPCVGFNKDWIVVHYDRFVRQANGFGSHLGSRVYVFNKTNLYANGAGLFTKFDLSNADYARFPATTFDQSLSTMYLIGTLGTGANQSSLRIYTVTGPVGAEVFSSSATVTVTNRWAETAPAGLNAEFLPQLGGARGFRSLDSTIQSLVYRNGSLWTTHFVFLPSGGAANRAAVQWWQLSPQGAILQRGRLDDPTGTNHYAFPSLSVNKFNAVLVGYSRFSSTQYVSANYAFRANDDPPNTLRSDTVLKAGEAPYVRPDPFNHNRWGDFSATVVDPVNDTDLWTIQEYAASPIGGQDRWGTWWGRISPIRVLAAEITGADVRIRFTSAPDQAYRVERTGSLAEPIIWEPVPGATDVAGTGGTVEVNDAGAANQSQRFYRVALLP